jgi:hypothetical protein
MVNIRTDLRETGREVVDWIHLGQERENYQDLVSTNEPCGSTQGTVFLD